MVSEQSVVGLLDNAVLRKGNGKGLGRDNAESWFEVKISKTGPDYKSTSTSGPTVSGRMSNARDRP